MNEVEKVAISQITENRQPHYEPYGWHHWPEFPIMSFQLRRALGETQEGGGAVSECFQAASRMIPGDMESWHAEWWRVAERNRQRADEAFSQGHVRTAMNCWLRAANYYRHAEFFLDPKDPRRLATFEKCESMSTSYLSQLDPPGEAVTIPYERDTSMYAYFVKSPNGGKRQPVLICCGGLDSYKDELWFMVGRGAVQRGMSVLMFDGPGQGGTLRRHGIPTRHDYEVPVGRCIDWLLAREDVDPARIAVCGSSLGGYYAARAASMEPRIAACVSHGAIWSIHEGYSTRTDVRSAEKSRHVMWVFGADSIDGAIEKTRPFKLEGVLERMRCPYLIVHGGHDVNGVQRANKVHAYAKEKGVDVTLRIVSAEETGADHCQHDNPTIGQELVNDWLADRFGIDQRQLQIRP